MHTLYLSHLVEIADGSCHAIAIEQNLCRPLRSACLYTTVLYKYTHAPAAYCSVATNTSAIPSTLGAHTPAVFPG